MQRNETIKNLFPGYYRKHDQDMETLADLTKRAKGDERSINEFARACGVSPSTISRLINKKNTTPNKDSLIKAIADNAVPESGVTLDMLLQAHGLEKISVYEGKERKSESVLEDIVIDRLLCDITQLGYKCEIEKEKNSKFYSISNSNCNIYIGNNIFSANNEKHINKRRPVSV